MKKIIKIVIIVVSLLIVSFSGRVMINEIIATDDIVENSDTALNGICDHEEDKFCSNLPLIFITTDDVVNKEEPVNANFSVINNGGFKSHIDDKEELNEFGTIKYRGNSSFYTFDKKQYRVKFYKDEHMNKDKSISLFGMSNHNDWILNGPFLDRSLVRNKIMYDISREIMAWAPDTRFCELFFNGEYMGVYLAIEPVSVGENRLDFSKFGLISGETPYLLKREIKDTEEISIKTYGELIGKTNNKVFISYPSNKKLTERQKEWIENDINKFEKTLYSNNFDDEDIGYGKFINVDSFVDYLIINEFSMNSDAGALSTYIYKNLDEKLSMCVWDFNNSFNNYSGTYKPYEKFYLVDRSWYNRLIQDRNFVDKIVERYRELRKGALSKEALNHKIHNNVEYLGDATDRNFEVWGYTLNQKLLSRDENGNLRDPKSYEEAVNMLKASIDMRLKFLDENIEELYKYCVN